MTHDTIQRIVCNEHLIEGNRRDRVIHLATLACLIDANAKIAWHEHTADCDYAIDVVTRLGKRDDLYDSFDLIFRNDKRANVVDAKTDFTACVDYEVTDVVRFTDSETGEDWDVAIDDLTSITFRRM